MEANICRATCQGNALLTCADGSTVADHVGAIFALGDGSEELQGLLPLPCFLTGADGSIMA